MTIIKKGYRLALFAFTSFLLIGGYSTTIAMLTTPLFPSIDFQNVELLTTDFVDCKETVKRGLQLVPTEHITKLETIVLHDDVNSRRGLANKNTIYLRCSIPEAELIAVLIHEIGHVVDLSYIDKKDGLVTDFGFENFPVYSDDDSLDYYHLSWSDCSETLQENVTDFVSEYAMSSCYEDFAETYTYYLLHNSDFTMAKDYNLALFSKYYFMKNITFADVVVNSPLTVASLEKSTLTMNDSVYIIETSADITKLSY